MVFGCCNHEGTTNAVRTDANVVVGDDDGEHQQSTVLTNPRRFEPTKERMYHLVIIGDITPNSVRLWVKVPNGGTWAVSLSKQSFRAGPAGSDLANMKNESTEVYLTSKLGPDGFVMQSVALDEDEKNTGRLTHCFEFTGLDEDTKYHYILAAEVDTDAGEGWKRAVIGCDNTLSDGQVELLQYQLCRVQLPRSVLMEGGRGLRGNLARDGQAARHTGPNHRRR